MADQKPTTTQSYDFSALPRYFRDRIDFDVRHGGHVWAGPRNEAGYGIVLRREHPRRRVVHRIVYEFLVAPIAAGNVLHHKCGLRSCVDPGHLEELPVGDHARLTASEQPKKMLCGRGHPLSGENLIVQKDGERCCRICVRAAQRRHSARRREDPEYRRRQNERTRVWSKAKRANDLEYWEAEKERRRLRYAMDPEYREQRRIAAARYRSTGAANTLRRARYAADPEYREKAKAESRKFRKRNRAA